MSAISTTSWATYFHLLIVISALVIVTASAVNAPVAAVISPTVGVGLILIWTISPICEISSVTERILLFATILANRAFSAVKRHISRIAGDASVAVICAIVFL